MSQRNDGAMERAPQITRLDAQDALERVIAKNYLDLNRPRQAEDTDNIALLAASWLEELEDVPNCYTEYRGKELHVLEACYKIHMEGKPKDRPLTVVDLRHAWDRLQDEWEAAAMRRMGDKIIQEARKKRAELGIPDGAGLELPPLDPEELLRRQKLIQETKAVLPWLKDTTPAAAPGQNEDATVSPLGHTKRLEAPVDHDGQMGIGGAVRAVKRKIGPDPSLGVDLEPVHNGVVVPPPPTKETAEEAAARLGFDVTGGNPLAVAWYVAWYRQWQDTHPGASLETADLVDGFGPVYVAKREEYDKAKARHHGEQGAGLDGETVAGERPATDEIITKRGVQ